MKRKNITLLGVASLLLSFGITSCDKTVKVNTVDNFTFDFATGEYNFKAVDDVSYYYVRVYSQSSIDSAKKTAEENNFEYSLMDASPSVAKRIRVRDTEVTEYTGELDISDFEGGEKYYAYVYTYVRTDDGDVNYAISEIDVSGIYKDTYLTPTVDKGSISGVSLTYVDENDDKKADDNQLTIKFDSSFLTSANLAFSPSYVVNIYDGNNKVGYVLIAATDVKQETTTTTNSSGNEETTVTAVAEKTYTVAPATDLTNYKATITIISNDAQAYYDSAESDKADFTKYSEQQPGGNDNPGGGQGSGS